MHFLVLSLHCYECASTSKDKDCIDNPKQNKLIHECGKPYNYSTFDSTSIKSMSGPIIPNLSIIHGKIDEIFFAFWSCMNNNI